MPLSPVIRMPRPRTSSSTAWMIVRSARLSSRSELSLAMAVGVATGVFKRGTRACSASTTSSPGGVKPPVIRTHGKSWVSASRRLVVRVRESRLSR
jgi:hypothetical protein